MGERRSAAATRGVHQPALRRARRRTRRSQIEHASGARADRARTGDDLAVLIASAVSSGADALGMAGGDGSLAPVAAAAAEHDLPFICLPAGTRNHLALDLGILRHDLVGALGAFTEGVERRIDMAEVNGRPFVNNLSLGVYGEAVSPSGYRDAKLRTMLDTIHEVLSSTAPTSSLTVTDDRARRHTAPLVVLVSNNPYALDQPLAQGSRPRLDTGQLGIVVVDRRDAEPPSVSSWSAPSLEIAGTAGMPAGVDGEAVTVMPTLRCTTLPGSLRVRISRHHPGVSPSALLLSRRRPRSAGLGA